MLGLKRYSQESVSSDISVEIKSSVGPAHSSIHLQKKVQLALGYPVSTNDSKPLLRHLFAADTSTVAVNVEAI